VEADESDRSFLMLAPVVAVVTTIDREHLDQYTSLEDIQGAFIQFVNRVPFYVRRFSVSMSPTCRRSFPA